MEDCWRGTTPTTCALTSFRFTAPMGRWSCRSRPRITLTIRAFAWDWKSTAHDIWNAGSGGKTGHCQEMKPALKEVKPEVDPEGVSLTHSVAWKTEGGDLLLSEERQIRFSSNGSLNLVSWHSTFTAVGTTALGQTKGIGNRCSRAAPLRDQMGAEKSATRTVRPEKRTHLTRCHPG